MKYSFCLLVLFVSLINSNTSAQAPNTWVQKNDMGGTIPNSGLPRIYGSAFTVGNKGYIGLGKYGSEYYNDIWEYDPVTDSWTQKASFPGGPREEAACFGTSTKGYLGTGTNGTTKYNDFYEYDPSTNTWQQKQNFPGQARDGAFAFCINNKGYVGGGYGSPNVMSDTYEYNPQNNTWTSKASLSSGKGNAAGFTIDSIGYMFGANGTNELWRYSASTNSWIQKTSLPSTARIDPVAFSINSKGYVGTGYASSVFYNDTWEYNPVSDSWLQKASLPVGRTYAVGFSLASYGYITTGTENGQYKNDLWRFDPVSNIWTKKSNYGAVPREDAVAFTLGKKAYVGLGAFSSGNYSNDFWEYEPKTDTWTQKANFAGTARTQATSFVVNGRAYVGLGFDGSLRQTDLWEYQPSSNTWIQRASLPANGRSGAASFTIGNKAYVGTGTTGVAFFTDFWEYDPTTNIWTQKQNFPGAGRSLSVSFSIGNKGYIGIGSNISGTKSDFYEYDPSTNSWATKANFGGGSRHSAACFQVGQYAYVGTGFNGTTSVNMNDLWEFNPVANTWTPKANFGGSIRNSALGFYVSGKGYIGTGTTSHPISDMWQYTPLLNSITDIAIQSTAFCANSQSIVRFNPNGTANSGNIYKVELSNSFGSFANPLVIGSVNSTWTDSIPVNIPSSLQTGNGYRIRIVSSNPVITSNNNGINISVSNPDDNNPCTIDACDPLTLQVTHTPVNVDDLNACTIDKCDSLTGNLSNTPVNTNDNNLCTIDGCDSLTGIFHTPVNVNDGIAFTDDYCDSVTGIHHDKRLHMKIFFEGFYSGNGMMEKSGNGGYLYYTGHSSNQNDVDSVTLSLIDPRTLTTVESSKSILQVDGSVDFHFNNASPADYYLKINHRNSIETWSANTVALTATNYYDFTDLQSKSYGSNQKESFDHFGWTVYSGDITQTGGSQNGIIDMQDYHSIQVALEGILLGYQIEDITGDGVVESDDYVIIDNNMNYGILIMKP